jgi:glyoxylase-like metal-dependent hydrolase (beta-lactamase superfamily II)
MILETFPVCVLRCNCTILGDEATGEAIVVDPGEDVPEILSRLAASKLTLKQIVITHGHIDHVGGAVLLKRVTGAPVFLNQLDLPMLAMMEEQAQWIGVRPPEVAPPDASADDGMKLGLANLSAEVIHTPGHTQGSICLYFAPQRLLIAGDTLFAGFIGRTDLPGGNSRKILRSIHDRLLPLPGEAMVIPGHGHNTTIAEEREHNPFLKGQIIL